MLEAFNRGNKHRSTSATTMNAHSSRSHMVLQVDVTTYTNNGPAVRGQLYLVDLAGSERVNKSGATGQQLKEAQGINKSLSALGDVMEALDKGQAHIPFRNSKLTFLLQSSLGGSARCRFIFAASPSELNSDETRCTFKFATRMRNITIGAAKKNVNTRSLEDALATTKAEVVAAHREAAKSESEVRALKKELDLSHKEREKLEKNRDRAGSGSSSTKQLAAAAAAQKKTEAELREVKAGARDVADRLREQETLAEELQGELDHNLFYFLVSCKCNKYHLI